MSGSGRSLRPGDVVDHLTRADLVGLGVPGNDGLGSRTAGGSTDAEDLSERFFAVLADRGAHGRTATEHFGRELDEGINVQQRGLGRVRAGGGAELKGAHTA